MNEAKERIQGLFIDIMELTLKDTIAKLKSGEADSKDIRNAITLLKDNGFTLRDLDVAKDPNEFLAELAQNMPRLPKLNKYGEIIAEPEEIVDGE